MTTHNALVKTTLWALLGNNTNFQYWIGGGGPLDNICVKNIDITFSKHFTVFSKRYLADSFDIASIKKYCGRNHVYLEHQNEYMFITNLLQIVLWSVVWVKNLFRNKYNIHYKGCI